MSDKPISVGDLVMVVRSGDPCICGGLSDDTGRVFRVADIRMSSGRCCGDCGRPRTEVMVAHAEGERNCTIYPLPRLKRLDPDALKDDVPTKEELHA